MQDRVAEQWDRQLLPHLENDLDNLYLGWDRKHVEALREDEDARATRYGGLFKDGLITRNEARGALDFDEAEQDGYFFELSDSAAKDKAKEQLAKALAERANGFDG
ncbi:MAG: hypothetical protein JNK63_10465 [Chthonomonas sp.]|nr:hypothetical protein [Chthonomonas sp.]